MAANFLRGVRRIESAEGIPEGVYPAVQSGYVVAFETAYGNYEGRAESGIRCKNKQCLVVVMPNGTIKVLPADDSPRAEVVEAARLVTFGNKSRLAKLSLALEQCRLKGELTPVDLCAMKDCGFDPIAEIAKQSGSTIESLNNALRLRSISYAVVCDALVTCSARFSPT